jgi:hypothetical protein
MELTVADHSVLASRALELRGAQNYRAGCFSSQDCLAQRESHQCVLHPPCARLHCSHIASRDMTRLFEQTREKTKFIRSRAH